MSTPVALSEYQDQLVNLSRDDASFIATQLDSRVTIQRAVTGEAYILNPRQFVGLVTLPSGRRLECRPKVPARNLFLMLAIALDLPDPFLDAPAEAHHIDEVLAFVVARFATLVEEQMNRGLYRSYVEEEENLPMVRGRIVIMEDVRRNYVLRHRTYCRYSEYSWDVPENRVLRQVVRLLAGWSFGPSLSRRLRALDAVMEQITPGRYVASDLGRFVYNRLSEDYRSLHNLCRFFLEGASPSDEVGPFTFEAFLLDMNRLFEAFVTQVLKNRAPVAISVHAQSSVALDRAGAVQMRPDVLVRCAGRAVLVADCKYKRLDAGEHHHHDLYQLLAYCTALGVSRGVLVYPQHLAPVNAATMVRNAEVSISEVSVNLSGDRDALSAECNALAEFVFAPAVSRIANSG